MAKALRAKSAQLLLRLSDELKERLVQASQASDRTITSEVNERLERSFEPPSDAGVDDAQLSRILECVQLEATHSGEFRLLLAEDLAELRTVVVECRAETVELRREASEVRRELADIRRSLQGRVHD